MLYLFTKKEASPPQRTGVFCRRKFEGWYDYFCKWWRPNLGLQKYLGCLFFFILYYVLPLPVSGESSLKLTWC